jgi:hypothetical protein
MLPPRITAVGGGDFRSIDDRTTSGQSTFGTGLTVTELYTLMRDGGAVISVTIGDVILRKMVYDDGRFHVLVEEARDRIALAGSQGRASVTYGPETVVFLPETGSRRAERAREVIRSAKVITTFRQVVERMGRTRRTRAGAVSVRLTAALVADIAGEAGIGPLLSSLTPSSLPSQRWWLYDGSDDFQDRWAEDVARALTITGHPGSHDDGSSMHSPGAALQALLVLEGAWYAVATRPSEASSRGTR